MAPMTARVVAPAPEAFEGFPGISLEHHAHVQGEEGSGVKDVAGMERRCCFSAAVNELSFVVFPELDPDVVGREETLPGPDDAGGVGRGGG